MKKTVLFILLVMSLVPISLIAAENSETKENLQANIKNTMIVNYDQLKTIINRNDNKLYVVNFWATWCKPCVEELPGFMEVNNQFKQKKEFKMILVSLDRASELDTKVKPFIAKNNIEAEVYLLDDNKRMNEWIPAIDKNWSGAIPATVFYRNGQKLYFIEDKLNKNELIKIIKQHL